jgi:mannose-1-phosphate guanylyltransferase
MTRSAGEPHTAMILCAGFGTRMGKLTERCPKPMLPVAGKPILEHTIERLAASGFRRLVINTHYLAEQISGYFGDGAHWGVRIHYSYEESPAGTAGAVRRAERFLRESDDFLVIYGDILTTEPFDRLLFRHRSFAGAQATIVLHRRKKSNSIVKLDEGNRVIEFLERPREWPKDLEEVWVNSGIYCLSQEIWEHIPSAGFSDFPKDVFSKLVPKKTLFGVPLSSYRCAIDSEDRYLKAQAEFPGRLTSPWKSAHS